MLWFSSKRCCILFHWPTFSLPRSLPQVHILRAEELCRPLPAHTSQASGPDEALRKRDVDEGVEELTRWNGGQRVQTFYATLSDPGDLCGLLSGVWRCCKFCGRWSVAERPYRSDACGHMKAKGSLTTEEKNYDHNLFNKMYICELDYRWIYKQCIIS